MNGKGDKQRPEQVPGAYARGWERIFGSGPEETAKDWEMMEIAGVPFQTRLDETLDTDTVVMPPPRRSEKVVVRFTQGSYRKPRIVDDPED